MSKHCEKSGLNTGFSGSCSGASSGGSGGITSAFKPFTSNIAFPVTRPDLVAPIEFGWLTDGRALCLATLLWGRNGCAKSLELVAAFVTVVVRKTISPKTPMVDKWMKSLCKHNECYIENCNQEGIPYFVLYKAIFQPTKLGCVLRSGYPYYKTDYWSMQQVPVNAQAIVRYRRRRQLWRTVQQSVRLAALLLYRQPLFDCPLPKHSIVSTGTPNHCLYSYLKHSLLSTMQENKVVFCFTG